MASPLSPCGTCRSTCCYETDVWATWEEGERLGLENTLYASGYSKPMVLLKKKEDGSCIFLKPWGCSVQKIKPEVCARMDEFHCTLWKEDKDKVSGKVKLGEPQSSD